jgi:hypothetical protein
MVCQYEMLLSEVLWYCLRRKSLILRNLLRHLEILQGNFVGGWGVTEGGRYVLGIEFMA